MPLACQTLTIAKVVQAIAQWQFQVKQGCDAWVGLRQRIYRFGVRIFYFGDRKILFFN
ncbi:hypothetical protein [Nostoc sp. DedQUE07]|uniref:hypothetical protein n=1 Tax=Nostoc sp. DedQUE07 TaxID=3075392 RepID=UPI002AD2D0E0|nr:hypothetical protein [Nostoc sp. DedQUE07]MDZ8133324.1 hypothetical protein [Nostoc sp. DedQUE07]